MMGQRLPSEECVWQGSSEGGAQHRDDVGIVMGKWYEKMGRLHNSTIAHEQ